MQTGWKYSLFSVSFLLSLLSIEDFWKYNCLIVWMTGRSWIDCTSISYSLVFVHDSFSISSTLTKAYCFTYFMPILSCRSSTFECHLQEKGSDIGTVLILYFDCYTVGLLVAIAPMYLFSLLPECLMYQQQKTLLLKWCLLSWLSANPSSMFKVPQHNILSRMFCSICKAEPLCMKETGAQPRPQTPSFELKYSAVERGVTSLLIV